MFTSCCGSNSGSFFNASSDTLATILCSRKSSFATAQMILDIVCGFFCLSHLTSSRAALEASHRSRSSFFTSAWSSHFAITQDKLADDLKEAMGAPPLHDLLVEVHLCPIGHDPPLLRIGHERSITLALALALA
eukprot:CAMPEP_0179161816 /NCGR_PEP_ID=MMETSP0796-20121207/79234_1 /TAXON_ID=73915 /ORGANISM="Pyrodinium bahamense, Strain pbaha01" /LENGTH=133 /DNA_ID=CAMNT_0020863957 /DNA_START=218 /DNA_END=617 /DNA_ORIENTATION=-